MRANALRDLSREEDFNEIAAKYIDIAAELIASVESDHLLSLLLEAPTDIAHLSAFEVAIKYEIHEFMDDSRIQMLMAHMWSEFDFLDPAKNFRTQDIGLFDLLWLLAASPAQFYYCPVGRFWTESVMYIAYVLLVTFVVDDHIYAMSTALTKQEITMWICNLGFIFGEITQMVFEGVKYLTDVGNVFDNLIMMNWVILAMIRMGCEFVFDECDASAYEVTEEDFFEVQNDLDDDYDASDAYAAAQTRNQPAILLYTTIWTIQLTILWSRICLIFIRSRNS